MSSNRFIPGFSLVIAIRNALSRSGMLGCDFSFFSTTPLIRADSSRQQPGFFINLMLSLSNFPCLDADRYASIILCEFERLIRIFFGSSYLSVAGYAASVRLFIYYFQRLLMSQIVAMDHGVGVNFHV